MFISTLVDFWSLSSHSMIITRQEGAPTRRAQKITGHCISPQWQGRTPWQLWTEICIKLKNYSKFPNHTKIIRLPESDRVIFNWNPIDFPKDSALLLPSVNMSSVGFCWSASAALLCKNSKYELQWYLNDGEPSGGSFESRRPFVECRNGPRNTNG